MKSPTRPILRRVSRIPKKIIAPLVASLWLLGCFYSFLQAPPSIAVTNMTSIKPIPASTETKQLQGRVFPADAELKINGQLVSVEDDGTFIYTVPLQEGDNAIRATITKGDKTTATSYHIHRTMSAQKNMPAKQPAHTPPSRETASPKTKEPAHIHQENQASHHDKHHTAPLRNLKNTLSKD